jgi:formyltetrahydrofolate hydrolase
MHAQRRYTLTASCPDRVGIVARVAAFIADNQGWILETSHHADEDTQRYFMRIEMKADSLPFDLAEFRRRFQPIANEFQMDWRIADSAVKKRLVVLVSKQEHCLYDLLARWQSKELDVDIPCVISNHETFRGFVEWHGIPFHHVPVTAQNKAAANAEIARLFEAARGDIMVLARYMQIIPAELCEKYPGRILNLPLRHRRTRRRPHHRAGYGTHRPRRHRRRPRALRQGHREGGAGARPQIPRRGSRAAQRQPHGRLQIENGRPGQTGAPVTTLRRGR